MAFFRLNVLGLLVCYWLVFPALSLAQSGDGNVMADHGPLPVHQRVLFFSSQEDQPAEQLLATEKRLEGRHYVTCDEWYLHLLEPHVRDLGGGYAGVGTDQAYLFIGWQKPHLAWLFDYDPWVKYLHQVYAVFFREAETPEDFLKYFEYKDRKQIAKFLSEKLADDPDAKTIVRVFRANQDYIGRRLKRLIKTLKKQKVPCYLTDQEMYSFVRTMVLNGRVRPMVGDLLKDKGMQGMAKVGRQLGVPLRVLYLSNAEGYWKYPQQFKDNIISQFFDDRSVVLRTVAAKWTNGDYRYYVQIATNFQEWMKREWVDSYRQVVPMRKLKGKGDIPVTVVDRDPDESAPKLK